jgi:hypothetical protein
MRRAAQVDQNPARQGGDNQEDDEMSKEQRPSQGRTHWLDETTEAPLIHDYTNRLSGFLEAMADGHIDDSELKAQETRLVALMKKVEPELGDALHEDVTHLLCELTAYNIMHTLHELMAARPTTKFRG